MLLNYLSILSAILCTFICVGLVAVIIALLAALFAITCEGVNEIRGIKKKGGIK